MNNLKAAIERLKEAGKASTQGTWHMVCCCRACTEARAAHNAAVEAAAAEALAEMEKLEPTQHKQSCPLCANTGTLRCPLYPTSRPAPMPCPAWQQKETP